MIKFAKITLSIITIISPLYLCSCNNITAEKYDQLKIGMEYNAVISILGKSNGCDGMMGIKNCIWGDE